jgi:hypothetical protein
VSWVLDRPKVFRIAQHSAPLTLSPVQILHVRTGLLHVLRNICHQSFIPGHTEKQPTLFFYIYYITITIHSADTADFCDSRAAFKARGRCISRSTVEDLGRIAIEPRRLNRPTVIDGQLALARD